VAAFLAAGTLIALAIIGIVSNGNHRPPGGGVALESPGVFTSPTPTPTPTPSPTASPTEIAFTQGIHLKIVALRARCWVQATADGNDSVPIYTGTLEVGQSQMLRANDSLKVILGNAEGVDLIVNGHDINYQGPPTPQTITLPDDIKSLT
jgi:hypothetical protein